MRCLSPEEFLYKPHEMGFHFYIVVAGEIVAAVGTADVDLSNRFIRQKSVDNKTANVYSKGAVFSEKIGTS